MPIDNYEQYKSNKSNHWKTNSIYIYEIIVGKSFYMHIYIYIYIHTHTLETKKLFDFIFIFWCVCGYL